MSSKYEFEEFQWLVGKHSRAFGNEANLELQIKFEQFQSMNLKAIEPDLENKFG